MTDIAPGSAHTHYTIWLYPDREWLERAIEQCKATDFSPMSAPPIRIIIEHNGRDGRYAVDGFSGERVVHCGVPVLKQEPTP